MISPSLPKAHSYSWLVLKYIGFLAAAFAAYYGASYYLSGGNMAKLEKRNEQVVQSIRRLDAETDAAKRADSYGGKTPGQTLLLFVEALEKGDYRLASAYIVLEKRNAWLSENGTEGPGRAYIAALKHTATKMKNVSAPEEGVSNYTISSPMEISFIRYETGIWKIGRLP